MAQGPTLPADDAQCGWFHTSAPRDAKPAHQGRSHAPWVVVGAGFTGLAAARQLALNFPDDPVMLVEAQQVGFGLAGRNAGFAIDLPHDIGAKDYIGDVPTARRVLKLNRFGQQVLSHIVATHQIECQWQPGGKYQAAVEKRGMAVLDAYRRGLDKLDEPWEMIAGADLPEHIGTAFYQQALLTPGTVLMQPAALVKGLADSLPGNVTLYENTPITGLEYDKQLDARPVMLKHAQGEIHADTLILANNGFAAHFGFLQRTMLPICLYGSLTRTLTPQEQARLGGKTAWGVIPADPHGSTVRRTVDQRILIRNSISFNPNGLPRPDLLTRFVKNHRRTFERRFPMLADVTFEYSWSGAPAMAHNHQSFFGQLAPNIYGSVCCNALGVTRGTACGTLLADWLGATLKKHTYSPGHHYGQDCTDVTNFLLASPGPDRVPPEPFLSLGINATLQWGQWRAGLER